MLPISTSHADKHLQAAESPFRKRPVHSCNATETTERKRKKKKKQMARVK